MIKKIKNGLNRRKVKIFLLFVLCATLAWFVSNLSETYTANTTFNLNYINVPDSLFFTNNSSKKEVQVILRTSGFNFLGFNFNRKDINVDLSDIENENNSYFLRQSVFRKQIESQLPNYEMLVSVDLKKDLLVDLYKSYTVEVPIDANVTLDLEQNHMLENELKITPNSITISGPKSEIDTIKSIPTETLNFSDVADSFEETVGLVLPSNLKSSKFSAKAVVVSGNVFRFSEKMIELAVEVVNIKEGMDIRTFPNKVAVLCKAKVDVLKGIGAADFSLVADFNTYTEGDLPVLKLKVVKQPKGLYSVKLTEYEVEFILNRK
ncbi:YbbR-like domain-containing protein [Cellulophaga sp. F20128]|uniref:CdaR family protein n=1 Tax=Cellulophaga sp. F20128 TaxID=2926413 RepID=UPI001FF10ADB|nr:YbbR-like domain-containing protein [Cellulophaga sp. F20128]